MPGHEVRTFGSDVGDDDDSPGIGLELTTDDIDDIAYSPELPVEERLGRLNALAEELRVRRSADMSGDMDMLLRHVKTCIRALRSEHFEGDATLEAAGMDTDSRADDDDPADHLDDEDDDGNPVSRRR